MKIQSYNHFDNSFRFLSAITFVLLAALLIAPNALAGPCFDKDGNLKPHAKPSCSTPDPGPEGVSFNLAWFNDIFVAVESQSFERANSDFESGDYIAQNPGGTEVSITTDAMSKRILKGSKNSDLCHAMDTGAGRNGPFFGFPVTFSYGWTDDCRDTECAIEISLSFEGDPILNFTGDRSDRLEVVMYATANDDAMENQDEPFLMPQDLKITSIEVDYNKAGTTRSLVQCRFGPLGHGRPEIHTTPQ